MKTTTVQLGRGGKIHGAYVHEGFQSSPMCGGNKATEGYRVVKGEVDCKNCLKIMASEAAKVRAEAEAEREADADAVKHRTAYDALFYTEDGNAIAEGICEPCKDSADNNADDTSAEEGFEDRSERWYEVAFRTYSAAHDDHMTAESYAAANRESDLDGLTEGPRAAYDAAHAEAKALKWDDADAHAHAMQHARYVEDTEADARRAEELAARKSGDAEGRAAWEAAFEKGRALGKDYSEAHDYADEVIRNARIRAAAPATTEGENMTEATYTTTHPTTGEAVTFAHTGTDTPLWATWNDQGEGFTRVGVSRAATEAAALKAIKRDGRNSVTPVIPGNSPEVIAESAIIAPNAGETAPAPIEKGNEMPPRKRAAAKAETAPVEATAPEAPKNDHADAIQRVKDLTAQVLAIAEAGDDADVDRAKELAEQAETVIGELPTEYRTALRTALGAAKRGEALTEGGAPAKKTAAVAKKTTAAAATKETQDYKKAIPDAEKVVADIASAFAKGVDAEKENSNSARTIAEKVLAARLFLKDKDGHPDIHGKSHAAKTIAGDFYTAAGAGFERTEDNEDALDRLVKSVNNLRNDVLVKYVRTITPEDAAKFFPLALKADPKAEPAAAIQKFYSIPAQSTFEIQAEKRRLERAARKALGAGDEKKAKELTEAIKTVGKSEGEGEGEGEAAAPTTAAEKRKAKHAGAVEAAGEKLAGIEADLEKINKDEAAALAADLESLIGKTSALVAMLKQK
jgi:hypothetical protein